MPRTRQQVRFRSREDHQRLVEAAARRRTRAGIGFRESASICVELGAAAYGIDLNTPVRETAGEAAEPAASTARRQRKEKVGFRGILEYLKQQMDESSSESYREWLLDYMSATTCPACHGKRLRPESLAVKVNGMSIADFTALPVSRAVEAVQQIKLNEREEKIAGRIVREIAERLGFLNAVGLGYMSLDRCAATLSGGEGQRIRLATQIGSRLRGVLYVLDEPSIGLHHRDNERLLKSLESLARSRQHRARRRARRRDHPPRRLRHRPRPRRRTPRRRAGRLRHAR